MALEGGAQLWLGMMGSHCSPRRDLTGAMMADLRACSEGGQSQTAAIDGSVPRVADGA